MTNDGSYLAREQECSEDLDLEPLLVLAVLMAFSRRAEGRRLDLNGLDSDS
jgi:hypothetical protein